MGDIEGLEFRSGNGNEVLYPSTHSLLCRTSKNMWIVVQSYEQFLNFLVYLVV